MSLNWGQLKTAIQAGLENTESTFVSNMEEIAKRSENRIYREVTLPDGFTETTGNFVTSAATLNTPAGFIRPMFLKVAVSSVNQPIFKKDSSFIREVYPNASTEGVPKYYALQTTTSAYLTTLIVAPTPDSTYPYTLGWYGTGATIVDSGSDASTSWLGNEAEDVLLSACILEGYLFMKGSPDLMVMYQADFDMKLASLRLQVVGMAQDDYQPNAAVV
jgi:hypothetical protein